MEKKFVVFVFIALFIIPFVSAIETQINIRTLPSHKVNAQILDPVPPNYALDSFNGYANLDGDITFAYKSELKEVGIKVQINDKEGKLVTVEKLGNFPTGSPLFLQVIKGNISLDFRELSKPAQNTTNATQNVTANQTQPATNITNQTTTNVTANQSDVNSTQTGLSGTILGITEKIKFSKTVYYIIIGFAALVVLFFVIRAGYRKYQKSPYIGSSTTKIDSQGRIHQQTASNLTSNSKLLEKELVSARNKIRELQSEINRMKNQERIREMEKRIQAEKDEIERLKKGF